MSKFYCKNMHEFSQVSESGKQVHVGLILFGFELLFIYPSWKSRAIQAVFVTWMIHRTAEDWATTILADLKELVGMSYVLPSLHYQLNFFFFVDDNKANYGACSKFKLKACSLFSLFKVCSLPNCTLHKFAPLSTIFKLLWR